MELFAEIGGLGGCVFTIISFLCTEITFMLLINKFIKVFYTNKDGIYRLDSDKFIPTEEELNKSQILGK